MQYDWPKTRKLYNGQYRALHARRRLYNRQSARNKRKAYKDYTLYNGQTAHLARPVRQAYFVQKAFNRRNEKNQTAYCTMASSM
jgi:hypothetical protein